MFFGTSVWWWLHCLLTLSELPSCAQARETLKVRGYYQVLGLLVLYHFCLLSAGLIACAPPNTCEKEKREGCQQRSVPTVYLRGAKDMCRVMVTTSCAPGCSPVPGRALHTPSVSRLSTAQALHCRDRVLPFLGPKTLAHVISSINTSCVNE